VTGKYNPVPNYYSKDIDKLIKKCLQVHPNDRPTAN